MNNKWVRAVIPALLIHISVGTVYCWSTFKQSIAEQIGMSTFAVGWAFSIAIFFLGMSAAVFGKIVEMNIHKSSLVSCICFTTGMIGTGLATKFLSGWVALIGIYLCYGVIMGIGLGVGYLTPVKTLMLWFEDNKGLATGISIMGFGLAKAIATPIMNILQNKIGISYMFIVLGIAYFILMFTGHILLRKPNGWIESPDTTKINIKTLLHDRQLIGIWIMFYLNIHCGLMIISYEKQILNHAFMGASVLTLVLNVVPAITAMANAFGRIGYSTMSDKLNQRNTVYHGIFISCIITSSLMIFIGAFDGYSCIGCIALVIYLIVINLGYGGGFSTLPALLSERYGMRQISQIHGLVLSAWAIAGLTGNNTTEIILKTTNNYNYVVMIGACLYFIALGFSVVCVGYKPSKVMEGIK